MSSGPYRSGTGVGAALRLWPTKAALVTGVLVGGAWFALAASGGDIRGITVASPVSLALVTFFLIGGLAALIREPDARNKDARAWALRHPWLFALWPALATAVLVLVARRALALWSLDESLLSSVFDGLGRGAAVFVCVALTGVAARRAASQSSR